MTRAPCFTVSAPGVNLKSLIVTAATPALRPDCDDAVVGLCALPEASEFPQPAMGAATAAVAMSEVVR